MSWRVFEDITHGWFGIEIDGDEDADPILYPVKISREKLDNIVSAYNAALATTPPPAQTQPVEAQGDAVAQMVEVPDGLGNRPVWFGQMPPAGSLLYAAPQPAVAVGEVERLRTIETAACAYVTSVNGEPEKDCWDTEDGKEAPGAERFASDWAWKAYDDAKQTAFDALRAALHGSEKGEA